jgi:hypothetical protein
MGQDHPLFGKHLSEEIRNKISKSHIGLASGSKNPMYGKHHTPEAKFLISKKNKGKLVGDKNPAWINGSSYCNYCPKFNESFKEKIRNLFGRKCFICNKNEEENGQCLAIHHIDYNKNSICNGKEWAFVPLCQKCHLTTNNNRYYWFNKLLSYWALNPKINFNNFFLS